MVALHKFLESNCEIIKISSYAVRPQPIFENAVVNTSIVNLIKTLTPVKKILCTKMYRKGRGFNLEDLLNNLQFIEVKKYKLRGRYPKVSLPIETSILDKLFSITTKVRNLLKKTANLFITAVPEADILKLLQIILLNPLRRKLFVLMKSWLIL